MDEQQVRHNLAQQTELYGAPLGDSIRAVMTGLSLSQAAVSRAIGVSAPMLSQLVSGHRIKLGNPQAVGRLEALLGLLDEIRDGLPHDQVATRVEQIATSETSTLTRARESGADSALAFQRLLRAVASGRDLAQAAELLAIDHPDVAEIIRVYGTGSPEDAATHYASVRHLI